jgi:molybdate transport system regulatory protein
MARLILRIELDSEARLRGDDIDLLEQVEKTGSISAAGRAHGITYRRAWTVLDALNRMFKTPVLATHHGGPDGGGARLTAFGREIIARYRALEAMTASVAERDLQAFEAAARPQSARSS